MEPRFYALLRAKCGLDAPEFDAQWDPAHWPAEARIAAGIQVENAGCDASCLKAASASHRCWIRRSAAASAQPLPEDVHNRRQHHPAIAGTTASRNAFGAMSRRAREWRRHGKPAGGTRRTANQMTVPYSWRQAGSFQLKAIASRRNSTASAAPATRPSGAAAPGACASTTSQPPETHRWRTAGGLEDARNLLQTTSAAHRRTPRSPCPSSTATIGGIDARARSWCRAANRPSPKASGPCIARSVGGSAQCPQHQHHERTHNQQRPQPAARPRRTVGDPSGHRAPCRRRRQ